MTDRLRELAHFRRYRFGFVAVRSDRSLTPIPGWRNLTLRGWHFALHPEAVIELIQTSDGSTALLIGEAFDASGATVSETLSALLRDPDDAAALDRLCGRWALFLLTPHTERVYHDPLGARSVYWRADGAVASHAALFGECLGVGRRRDVEDFMAGSLYRERVTVRFLPGDITLFEDVYALIPNNYVDLGNGSTVRFWPRRPMGDVPVTDLLSALDAYLFGLARFADRSERQIVLGATGGVDSRLVMAALMRSGVDFESFTSGWKRLQDEERAVVTELVSSANLRHQVLPASKRGPFVDLALQNSSGVGGSSHTVEWFVREFPTADPLFISGHGGEVICAPAALRNNRPNVTEFDPDVWARSYSRVRSGAGVLPEHREFVKLAFADYFERGHVSEVDGTGVHPQDLFYWEYRLAMWCGGNVMNGFDAGIAAMPAFTSRTVFETAFSVSPVESRRTKDLFRTMTSIVRPELAWK